MTAVVAELNKPDGDGVVLLPGSVQPAPVAIGSSEGMPLGKGQVWEDGNRLVFSGRFNLQIKAGREWRSNIAFDQAVGKPVQKWSLGFSFLSSRPVRLGGVRVQEVTRAQPAWVRPVLKHSHNTFTISTDEKGLANHLALVEGKAVLSRIDHLLMQPEAEREAAKFKAHMDSMQSYKFAPVSERPELYKFLFEVSAQAAELLGMESAPVPRMLRVAEDRKEGVIHGSRSLLGIARRGETIELPNGERPVIYVRVDAGRKLWQMARTVAHECRHVWQYLQGWDMSNSENVEADAYEWADWFISQTNY